MSEMARGGHNYTIHFQALFVYRISHIFMWDFHVKGFNCCKSYGVHLVCQGCTAIIPKEQYEVKPDPTYITPEAPFSVSVEDLKASSVKRLD